MSTHGRAPALFEFCPTRKQGWIVFPDGLLGNEVTNVGDAVIQIGLAIENGSLSDEEGVELIHQVEKSDLPNDNKLKVPTPSLFDGTPYDEQCLLED